MDTDSKENGKDVALAADVLNNPHSLAYAKLNSKTRSSALAAAKDEEHLGNDDDDESQGPTADQVYLRMECVGKTEARILTFTVWFLTMILILLSIAVISTEKKVTSYPYDYSDVTLYAASTITAAVCVGVLGVLGYKFITRLLIIRSAKCPWTFRRIIIATDGGVLLALTFLNSVFWMTGHILIASKPRCELPISTIHAIGAMTILRYTCFSLMMLWTVIQVHGMRIYNRAVDSSELGLPETHKEEEDPDFLLCMDRPWKDQVKLHRIKVLVWLALEIAIITPFAIVYAPSVKSPDELPDCGQPEEECGGKAQRLASVIVATCLTIFTICAHTYYMRRAIEDHTKLPYSRYRLTNIYLKITKRHTTLLLLALIIAIVFVDIFDNGACVGGIRASVGSLTGNLVLALFALAATVLFVPSAKATVPAQALEQKFAWTEDDLKRATEQRNAELLRKKTQGNIIDRLVSGPLFHILLDDDRGRAKAAETSMFVIETAVRTFHWAKYAYNAFAGSVMNQSDALSMFDLEHFEEIYVEETDSLVVLGWSRETLVVSFRGTSSRKNVMTDLKAIPTRYQTSRSKVFGMMVHSGFLHAWRCGDFSKKVLAKATEIITSEETLFENFRVVVTGHSLGGALGILASLEIKEENPLIDIVTYTFGAPRVGNKVFANYYNGLIANCFALINKEDPVPRIPKFGYKRSGTRVSLNMPTGDLIVKPTFFETSMLQTSSLGVVKEHMTATYALSLANIIKAQFYKSKRLPGGEYGALSLVRKMDLGKALMVDNLDEESVKDPTVKPVMSAAALAGERTEDTPAGQTAIELGTTVNGEGVAEG